MRKLKWKKSMWTKFNFLLPQLSATGTPLMGLTTIQDNSYMYLSWALDVCSATSFIFIQHLYNFYFCTVETQGTESSEKQ